MIGSEKALIDYISSVEDLDAIVVEGYDGVGKGRILKKISEFLGVTPYRPDYNLWQRHNHNPEDRWKVSGFFWDIYSHFRVDNNSPLLFDRGILSGSVYNNDETIAEDYKKIIKDMKVLNILVVCSESDYKRFIRMRSTSDVDEELEWMKYIKFTKRYLDHFEIAHADYICYLNHYNKDLVILKDICEGCGHYNYGWCRHPAKNCIVDNSSPRCEYSEEREVQDIHDTEVHSL